MKTSVSPWRVEATFSLRRCFRDVLVKGLSLYFGHDEGSSGISNEYFFESIIKKIPERRGGD